MSDLSWLLDHSLTIIRANQAPTGAYLASPTFPPYRYSWFRDGAFIAEAMSRVGDVSSADAFFGWCARVVTDRRSHIEELIERADRGERVGPHEHLHTRFTVDGKESVEPWWTFQLDGYGTWLWALHEHAHRHGRPLQAYEQAIALTVRYLAAFWDEPCYDWWEEHAEQRHTSTLAAIAAGAESVAHNDTLEEGLRETAADVARSVRRRIDEDGVRDGHLTKWLGTDAVDASLIACVVPFGLYAPDDPVAKATIEAIEQQLTPAGVHRYLDDVYYGGGQWVLLAGCLGACHAVAGELDRATELLDWIVAQADGDGHLPEQVADDLLHPEHETRWIERWGPSANPLLWSHAMFLTLADHLGHRPDPAELPQEPHP